MAQDLGAGEEIKVFWFFFSKKNFFLFWVCPSVSGHMGVVVPSMQSETLTAPSINV
jgi:hypothetical protein